jgi:hypothetical protein
MDSRKIKVCGLIKDLYFKLIAYLEITLLMEITVIDILNAREKICYQENRMLI